MTSDESATPSVHPSRRARRLTVFVERGDRFHRGPVAIELLKRVRRGKFAGATVFEGQLGFGASRRIHQSHLVVEDAPRSIVVIDRPERIDAFLDEIADLIANLLVVVEDVDVVDT